MQQNIEIKIGTKFYARNKRKDLCEVVDIWVTKNSRGEIIKIMYLCEHLFMGQKIKHEECSTTIKMAIFYNGEVK